MKKHHFSKYQLLEGSIASLNSTLSLIADAKILVENNSFAHAYFFMLTALEEYYKRCVLSSLSIRRKPLPQEDFNFLLNTLHLHDHKTIGSRMLAYLGTGNIDAFFKELPSQKELIKQLKSLRESLLYANWNFDINMWTYPNLFNDDAGIKTDIPTHLKNISLFVSAWEKAINKNRDYLRLLVLSHLKTLITTKLSQ